MVGKTLSEFLPRAEHRMSRIALMVKSLSYPRPEGGFLVEDLSFVVHAGEIVGLYGLMGAGRTELLECLIGLHADYSGEISIEGTVLDHSFTIDMRIESGLVLIPEDRQAAGIVHTLSVSDNIILANIRKYTRLGVLPRRPGLKEVNEIVNSLSIKASSPDQQITALSGGNQQKVVVAKALLTKPKLLLMDEPTRGIDVNAKSEIFSIMNELAKGGIGILFASSELKEIIALSDRVLVMARGRLTGEFERGAYSENDLVMASSRDLSMLTDTDRQKDRE
jgi:erythritol transport system ATP-binding protein